jgi:hypothetical protein
MVLESIGGVFATDVIDVSHLHDLNIVIIASLSKYSMWISHSSSPSSYGT